MSTSGCDDLLQVQNYIDDPLVYHGGTKVKLAINFFVCFLSAKYLLLFIHLFIKSSSH